MQVLDGRFIYSATDLNNYLECGHLVALEREVALRERARPERDETVELIAEKGLAHEAAYLDRLRAECSGLVEIAMTGQSLEAIERAAAETIRAMRAGAPVIYQGTFFDGKFLGKSDFLIRVETPSDFGSWSYEVADTKLALSDKPYFIIQLCHYSEHVARVQGAAPQRMRIVLGSNLERPYRVEDFAAYYRHLKESFLRDGVASDAYPFPCSHCKVCDWAPACEARRTSDDHLSLVAGLSRENARDLEGAGTTRLAQLAEPGAVRPLGMQEKTFARLRRQASLQLRGRVEGGYFYELLEHREPEGFGLMPPPAAGDVFFDMEGDQFYEIGIGLEYLFGCYCPDDAPAFRAFWGTDRAGEKRAFEEFVDFLVERRKRYPGMHVYHYAPYEKVALRRLAQRHDSRESEIDRLLREEVLVDLYAVVRQTVAISQPSYSIKKLEPFYGMDRAAAVRKGDDSIVQFERWLKDPERRDILTGIERYNEEDCRSTWLLREWLLARRDEYATRRAIAPPPFRGPAGEQCHPEPVEGCGKCERRVKDEREAQKISGDQRRLLEREGDAQARLLGHLLSYHRKEENPVWWALFDRCDNIDQLIEFDREAIGGLVLRTDLKPDPPKRSNARVIYTYAFPEQDYHPGDSPYDPATKKPAGQIVAIDSDANTLQLSRGGTIDDAALVTALIPGAPHVANTQKEALARIASQYLDGTLGGKHPALLDVLGGAFPRLTDRAPESRIQPDRVSPESLYAVVAALDRSYLVAQGPPGTGKTYAGARVIVRLLAAGKRVGVMANGHKAIHNMLHEIERVAAASTDPRLVVNGLHKHSNANLDSPYRSRLAVPSIQSADDNKRSESGEHNLVSGNAWLFARPGMIGQLDYLFVDEAGQTSLADAIAVAPCADNIVFFGDPMQLAQVSQGHHLESAGRSVLAHLLGDAATVPENRGILLDTSYRMHPAICDYISTTVYDGRLHADPPTANNRVDSPSRSGAGLQYIPIGHSGNSRVSPEEAERIGVEVHGLLAGGTFVRKDEGRRPIGEADILVVTPYNLQRKRILAVLCALGHPDVRVGTVDKFQGQEAPVVFYSMATSSGDDLPRTMEFLFEKNRFNVAVSRAQCLCVLVCSPRLLEIRCNHVEQIPLVNLVCRYVECATQAPAGASPALVRV